MERRQIPTDTVAWAVQPQVEKETQPKSNGTARRFFRNFSIFFVCDVVCLVIAVILIPSQGVDIEKLTESALFGSANLSLVLAFLTAKIFVPKQLKTLWFIGIAAPLGMFFFMMLSH